MLKARILSCADRGPGGAGEAEGEGTLLTFGCVWVVFWRFGACVEFSPVVGVAGVSGLLTIGGGGEAGDFPESSVFASGGYWGSTYLMLFRNKNWQGAVSGWLTGRTGALTSPRKIYAHIPAPAH